MAELTYHPLQNYALLRTLPSPPRSAIIEVVGDRETVVRAELLALGPHALPDLAVGQTVLVPTLLGVMLEENLRLVPSASIVGVIE